MKQYDETVLGEGCIYPADMQKTGLNLNELIVGTSGCGKTMSIAYPRMLKTYNTSLVVPITKKALREKFKKLFIERGYDVEILDFADAKQSTAGYDPLDYVYSELDATKLAANIIGGKSYDRLGNQDEYWNKSATSVVSAFINLELMNATLEKRKPKFSNVIKTYKKMVISTEGKRISTNVDRLFDRLEARFPDNPASNQWKTVKGLAETTASCIFSIVNNALDKIITEDIIDLLDKQKKLDFTKFGQKKTVLFITTSPVNTTLQPFINLVYADMIRCLFEYAESRADSTLPVKTHIMFDDFACGSKIAEFEDYISVFRAAGISVTLLLQSESQLTSMYGDMAAVTIINNCDSYVYMGGIDIQTARNISARINKPVHKILSMPLEQVLVFRRGAEPIQTRRYQTLNDPEYKKLAKEAKTEKNMAL